MCLVSRERNGSGDRPIAGAAGGQFGLQPTPFLYVDNLRPDAMAKGTVDFFNDSGGYGFIETEDADEDVFFHMEDIGGPDLEEGQEVEFDIVEAEKGPRAENLKRL
ncbi:MAG: CspA family cold shock protein [Halobacteriales archaeon]